GMQWDGAPVWQSQRQPLYQSAFRLLLEQNLVYGCACTRKEISDALESQDQPSKACPATMSTGLPHERPYPGTCRAGPPEGRPIRAWRFKVPPYIESFHDRWLGAQQQDLANQVGDFIIKRADGLWAYQLAVVADDGAQGVTDIVRGADLLTSTARQRVLARSLNLHYPSVMHVPLILDAHGQKLSKQNHAPALDCANPAKTLNLAWQRLGFEALPVNDASAFWRAAVPQWATRFKL
ncbi:MAG TPA: glutamate--tRNA ligase family protein, partial [Eoetvoesiella sp.]